MNRWKKRGLALMPNKFGLQWSGRMFNAHVMINNGDASVSVAHGGIDVGQGINTKVIIGSLCIELKKLSFQ